MKLIPILFFLPLIASAQTLTFHEGAGINPKHIESLGYDSGWVDVWVGPMAKDGDIIRIHLEDWGQIERIDIVLYGMGNVQHGYFNPKSTKPEHGWFGCNGLARSAGHWIRIEYKAKRKKA